MTRHPPTTGIRIDLRTIHSTDALLMLLACAGTAAGAMKGVVDDDDGGAMTRLVDVVVGELRAACTSIILVARVLIGLLIGFGMRFETVGGAVL